MTNWWSERKIADNIKTYQTKPDKITEDIQRLLGAARVWQQGSPGSATPMRDVESHIRYIVLAGLILWAKGRDEKDWKERSTKDQIRYFLESPKLEQGIAEELDRVFRMKQPPKEHKLVWTVSINRRATPAVTKSVPAVKADAARTLFTVNC